MKQAIEFSHTLQQFLHVGARRKSHIAYMIVVHEGAALIRLGKEEFLVTRGQGFWLPFNCLHALTILPGTRYGTVSFSSRLTKPLCQEAGFFTVSPLIDALLVELQRQHKISGQPEVEKNLLNVIADQVAYLKVHTDVITPGLTKAHMTQLSLLLKGAKITEPSAKTAIASYLGCSLNEFEACLTMREALRLFRSGRKLAHIAETLNTSPQTITALAPPILGHSLA